MIDHRHAIELAAMSLDFALDDADRLRLDEHLQGCPSCRLERRGCTATRRRSGPCPTSRPRPGSGR